jgi:hypothetical protein
MEHLRGLTKGVFGLSCMAMADALLPITELDLSLPRMMEQRIRNCFKV